MANWYGTSRSNYFRVKDPVEFEAWVERTGLTAFPGEVDGYFGVADDTGEGWPTDPDDEDAGLDFPDQLARYVLPGDVVILMSAGAEKLRYVSGIAIAFRVDEAGVFANYEQVCLDKIYDITAAWPNVGLITEAAY
jgi:hypothetical protein